MTREQAISKAQDKAHRFGRAYMVTSRTDHPAHPGETVYLTFPKADKSTWASSEKLILDTDETTADYAAGVAKGSSLPAFMTMQEMSEHCRRVLERELP
jgi:hypothetical protein